MARLGGSVLGSNPKGSGTLKVFIQNGRIPTILSKLTFELLEIFISRYVWVSHCARHWRFGLQAAVAKWAGLDNVLPDIFDSNAHACPAADASPRLRSQRSNVTRRFSFSSRLVFERTGRTVHFTTGVKDGTRPVEWDGEGLPVRPWRRSLDRRRWLATWDGMPPHLAGDRAGNGGETINKGRFKAERNGTERHPPPASHNLKQRPNGRRTILRAKRVQLVV